MALALVSILAAMLVRIQAQGTYTLSTFTGSGCDPSAYISSTSGTLADVLASVGFTCTSDCCAVNANSLRDGSTSGSDTCTFNVFTGATDCTGTAAPQAFITDNDCSTSSDGAVG